MKKNLEKPQSYDKESLQKKNQLKNARKKLFAVFRAAEIICALFATNFAVYDKVVRL